MRIGTSALYLRALKKFVKNSRLNAEKVKKTLNLFTNSPSHPSLKIEKLGGTDLWTIRVDKGNRIFFIWEDKEEIILIDVGKHDKYRKY